MDPFTLLIGGALVYKAAVMVSHIIKPNEERQPKPDEGRES